MKPLVSYYGGKQRMVPHLLPIVNRMPHTVYVEPFAGGAALLFAKPRRAVGDNSHYREVLNDTNDLLITMYRTAVKQPEAFQLEIEATLYSQSDHARAKEICANPPGHDDLTIAWAVYVNLSMSFSSVMGAGWATSVIGPNHAPVWVNKKRALPAILRRLSAVHISNEDAFDCIRRWDSPQTLFYLDPPYPGTDLDKRTSLAGYTTDDWAALCGLLDTIHGSYVLSNYAQEVEPATAQQRIEIEAVNSSSPGRIRTQLDNKRTEIVWTCDRSHAARGDLARHLRQMSLGV